MWLLARWRVYEYPGYRRILAEMLGVRRQTVTVIVGRLQAAGCITSRHGVVRVLSRRGLEATCCECYGVTRSLYDQIIYASSDHLN